MKRFFYFWPVRLSFPYNPKVITKEKIAAWCNSFDICCFLDSNNYSAKNKQYSYSKYEYLFAAGSETSYSNSGTDPFLNLNEYIESTGDFIFGFFTYDIKNHIEKLTSKNRALNNFPEFYFFQPKYLFESNNNGNFLSVLQGYEQTAENILSEIEKIEIHENHNVNIEKIQSAVSKDEYISTINEIKKHIQHGDIYEMNYCQEFYSKADIDPLRLFFDLIKKSPTPFSCYFKHKELHLICSSPERFIAKRENEIISQPIKGTAGVSNNYEKNMQNIIALCNDKKEISENIMIVDLVRNDLSKIADMGTVKVEELCGAYTFSHVNQLISTITAKLKAEISFTDIIKSTFPMGSMTGAPKHSAMQLIEKFETTKRGLYSGTVGYIDPNFDFDFNVVIRSIFYNSTNKNLSFNVGGAITHLSQPEKEYEECLLKASAIMEVLKK